MSKKTFLGWRLPRHVFKERKIVKALKAAKVEFEVSEKSKWAFTLTILNSKDWTKAAKIVWGPHTKGFDEVFRG